ncbi:MAG: helix-turn-helix transcriptional regulator [Bacteroidales bacterium]|nr:helix-turn-helix transcriptional regulator [Bacteroidales bacterium]
MKKIILGICENNTKRVNRKNGFPNMDVVKLMIIDTTKKEDDYEFPIIPLKPNAYNRISWDVLCDLLSPDNQKYLIVPVEEDEIVIKENRILTENSLTTVRFSLTYIQKVIMDLASEGLSTKEIAERLHKSYHTIKNHFSHIYEKMGVRSLPEATEVYLEYRKKMN